MSVEKLKDININGKLYNLYSCTGKVASFRKYNNTEVSGSGGDGKGRVYTSVGGDVGGRMKINPIKVESKTTILDQIILADEHGQEYDFEFQNLNLNCREGNKISVVRAIKQGKQIEHCIIIYNHNTKVSIFDLKILSSWLRPSWIWAFVVFPVGILVIPQFVSMFLNIWLSLLLFFVSLLVTPSLFAGIREGIGESRAIKFKNSSEVRRIIDYLETT